MNRDTWCVLWSHVIAKTRVVKWFRDNGFNLCKVLDCGTFQIIYTNK